MTKPHTNDELYRAYFVAGNILQYLLPLSDQHQADKELVLKALAELIAAGMPDREGPTQEIMPE